MEDKLWSRIKQWYCSKVGHLGDELNTWYNGDWRFTSCKRCQLTYRIDNEK